MNEYKVKENKDGIIEIKEKNNIIAKYKINDRWREVNYYFKDNKMNIRLFDKYKKYLDVIVNLGEETIQYIP